MEQHRRKIAWLTDIHLNFLKPRQARDFCRDVMKDDPDAVLIGGDIAEAGNIRDYLEIITEEIFCPVYFVLGNHDFYNGSIAAVRSDVRELVWDSPRLHWLPDCGIVELSATTCLIGHDCWADGRLGD